jgi:hypothetical protein
VLLTIGLLIIAVGNLATAATVAAHMPYPVVAIGMLLTSCGAGLLNGEAAKVSMSVVPPERGGMASGIGGTLRFVGLVTGITGLGAVLTSETERHFVQASSVACLTGATGRDAHLIVTRIIAGDVEGVVAQVAKPLHATMLEVSRYSFVSGFTTMLLAAGAIATIAAALTFALVSSTETAPTRLHPSGRPELPENLD